MEWRARESLTLIPAVAAASVGLLYTAGAVVKTGQLRDANVSVRDTLPLVPLEQILALGIGILVPSLGILFALGAVVAVLVAMGPERGVVGFPGSPRTLRRFRVGLLIFMAGWAVWVFYALDVFSAIPVMAILITAYAPHRARNRRELAGLLSIYYVILVAAHSAEAYLYPTPLPGAEVRLRGGAAPVRGTLITMTGSTIVVSGRDNTFRAIPSDRVAVSIVRSRQERHEPRPPLRALWDTIRG